jgi:hypothetical protein
MRKMILLLLALPLLGVAQNNKTVVNVNRVFVKQDKTQQFEKALTAHAQKYHTGDVKWRVFTVESGPDAGAYHITEGPTSWEGVDKRGNLGKEHTNDWDMNIAPLLTDRGSVSYSVYREDLSTIALTDYTDKIAITHVYPKLGYNDEVEAMVKSLKKTWEQSGQTVAVYESASSGEAQLAIVTRYKNGLIERTIGYRKPMKDRYTFANGDGSWDNYLKGLRTYVDRTWSELLFFHHGFKTV